MRDIVSEIGTFFTGLSACPTIAATQTSPAVALAGYDGAMIYILNPTASSAGTMTPVVQVTNDNGSGVPVAANWTAVPATDLILWQATSNSNYAPVKAIDANGLPTGNLQPAALTSTVAINQRVGYIGSSFVSGGVTYEADWIRVVSTDASSWSAPYDVIICLGRARDLPAAV